MEEVIYTCIGKGGRYKIVDNALGAGNLRTGGWTELVVYKDVESEQLYVRELSDFQARMEILTTEATQDAG